MKANHLGTIGDVPSNFKFRSSGEDYIRIRTTLSTLPHSHDVRTLKLNRFTHSSFAPGLQSMTRQTQRRSRGHGHDHSTPPFT
ncbi:hypothetical protein TNCV_2566501 [Trichonephila clavipes]|uniref:Uncharacterized protein n=1 Tax=Trichonephila clavipes TaxID=2585209 RepID=A0A8X6WLH7_TRICX|nr:hypothetical protein TNCV_2566501 [Trichonephila clavipes]